MENSLYEKKICGRYIAEFFGALVLYCIVLVMAMNVGKPMKIGLEKTLIVASPMGPFLLIIWVIARMVRRVDEYLRMKALENLSLAAAMTAVATFTYGFMEIAGYPKISMFAVWPMMCTAWICVVAFRLAFDR